MCGKNLQFVDVKQIESSRSISYLNPVAFNGILSWLRNIFMRCTWFYKTDSYSLNFVDLFLSKNSKMGSVFHLVVLM